MFNLLKHTKGFTLIEVTITVAIIGILLAGFVGNLGNQIDNSRRAETNDELKSIKQALFGFSYEALGAYLPCPDCNDSSDCLLGTARDGIEDRNGNVCIVDNNEVGNLPWATLGLSGGDAWGTRYRYWVDVNYSNSSNGSITLPKTTFDDEENIILERNIDGSDTQLLADNVIAVIFSHGKNSYGGISVEDDTDWPSIPASGHTDEIDNTNADADFISRLPTSNLSAPVGEFDDIVIWISELEYKSKLVNAGLLP